MQINPVYYRDYGSLFLQNFEAMNVLKFRIAGAAIEIVPTVNSMAWTGSVQVYRGPVELSQTVDLGEMKYTITGLAPLISSYIPEAVHPFNLGCYCVAKPDGYDYEFHNVLPKIDFGEVGIDQMTEGTPTSFGVTSSFPGMGGMQATIMKIPAYNAVANSCAVRAWSNVEFIVNPSSAFCEYSHVSPTLDPVAMALIRRAFDEIQTCVPYYENDNMWSKVLEIIKKYSRLLSVIPGPIGGVASGTSLIAESLAMMSL